MVESHTHEQHDHPVAEANAMTGESPLVEGGGVTTPKGFVAGSAYAGIKTYAKDKADVGILLSEKPCATAGVYTLNQFVSPSVTLTKQRVAEGAVRGVFVSSGIANTGVGEQGLIDATESANLAAAHAGVEPGAMAIGTTGVIGVELPMALIRGGIPNIQLSKDGGSGFARAILTTDRVPKSVAVQVKAGGKEITIGGCAKGSGMIHPNMATLLAYLTTDAAVDPSLPAGGAEGDGRRHVQHGDHRRRHEHQRHRDAVRERRGGQRPDRCGTPAASVFTSALYQVCGHLSRELVRDAEGSSKIFSVRVNGALSREDARLAARAIASSVLVKSGHPRQ